MAKIKTRWTKITPFGDYKETKDRTPKAKERMRSILCEVRKLSVAGKHAGSKPLSKLLRGLAKAHEAISKSK